MEKKDIEKKEYVLYGLTDYKEVVDKVKVDINMEEIDFNIEMVLTEALTNAFEHGNKKDAGKPIFLRYYIDKNTVKFEIEDCGDGLCKLSIPEMLPEDRILNPNGRGLYLIKCFSDAIEFKTPNTLLVTLFLDQKNISCPRKGDMQHGT